MRIKILKEDTIFSKYIRDRDKWTCQKCTTKYYPPARGLECSHFWGRGNWAVRFDEDNADALCTGCHMRSEGEKQGWYRDFKIKQLGEERYNRLRRKANSTLKKEEAIRRFNKKIAQLNISKDD